eukprot:1537041-Karenia_brevis.AAC.1
MAVVSNMHLSVDCLHADVHQLTADRSSLQPCPEKTVACQCTYAHADPKKLSQLWIFEDGNCVVDETKTKVDAILDI